MRTIRYPSYPTAQRRRAALGAAACALGFLVALTLPTRAAPWVAVGFLVLMAGAVGRWHRYRSGERGEDRAARALRRLDDRYVLLRNWTSEGSHADVDLVLLGPHGALVIEAKNHAAPVRRRRGSWEIRTKGGWRRMRSPADQLRRNAERISRRLRMPVHAVIVFNDRVDLDLGEEDGSILRRRELRRFVRRLPDEGHDAEALAERLSPA